MWGGEWLDRLVTVFVVTVVLYLTIFHGPFSYWVKYMYLLTGRY